MNLLLADVVDVGLPPIHVDRHDLLARLRRHWVSGRGRRLRYGWHVKLVDEVKDRNDEPERRGE
jgi:hypothetical protein